MEKREPTTASGRSYPLPGPPWHNPAGPGRAGPGLSSPPAETNQQEKFRHATPIQLAVGIALLCRPMATTARTLASFSSSASATPRLARLGAARDAVSAAHREPARRLVAEFDPAVPLASAERLVHRPGLPPPRARPRFPPRLSGRWYARFLTTARSTLPSFAPPLSIS
jgi:hypothetical protein